MTLPADKVDELPVNAFVVLGATVPMDAVDMLPVIATEYVMPTVPTLPVPTVPSSWMNLPASKVPGDSVDAFPLMPMLLFP